MEEREGEGKEEIDAKSSISCSCKPLLSGLSPWSVMEEEEEEEDEVYETL